MLYEYQWIVTTLVMLCAWGAMQLLVWLEKRRLSTPEGRKAALREKAKEQRAVLARTERALAKEEGARGALVAADPPEGDGREVAP